MHRKCNVNVTSSTSYFHVITVVGHDLARPTAIYRLVRCLNNHILLISDEEVKVALIPLRKLFYGVRVNFKYPYEANYLHESNRKQEPFQGEKTKS